MGKPIRLKTVLRQRHWQTYRTFKIEYDRAAREVDKGLVGSWPSRAQLHRWLAGELKGLPYPDHCRIVEAMFPGWTVEQLFMPAPDEPPKQPEADGQSVPPATSELMQAITAGLSAPDDARRDWGAGMGAAKLDIRPLLVEGNPPTGQDATAYTLGRRLVTRAKVLRLGAEETRQLATLAGNVVNLGLDIDIDIDASGDATVTYRHDLLNLSSRPLTRLSHELWFEHTDGSLRLTPVSPRGRTATIQRRHEAANLANFSLTITPPVQPGETVTVEFACAGPRFIKDHYWRQCMMRYTRHLTIRLHHANAALATYSAIEEHTDGVETQVTDSVIRGDDGPDIGLTVTRDYLSPNQYVTLRWDVAREPAR